MTPEKNHQSPIIGFILASMLILLGYVMISVFRPFSALGNTLLMSTLTLVSAISTATMSTLVFLCYIPGDMPRPVWLNFTIGFWLWVVAEFNFGLYALNIPVLTFARVLWLSAFIFFSYALYLQHKIISGAAAKSPLILLIFWDVGIILSVLIVYSMGMPLNFENIAEYFSALANLTVGVIGIKLAYTFRGGALARPWLGFVGLALSDIIYAISTVVGDGQTNPLVLATELVYIAAYLSMAFGFYGQYLLLKFGVNFSE